MNHPNDHIIQLCKYPFLEIFTQFSPAMCTKDGELFLNFGVMGGFMQPQGMFSKKIFLIKFKGHVQVFLNIVEFGMDPQRALDVHRFCISPVDGNNVTVLLEDGMDEKVVNELKKKNHTVKIVKGYDRCVFGRGQVILKNSETNVYWGGR